jgi:putative transposase
MGLVSFTPGSIVYVGKDRYEIVATYDLKNVLAKSDTGEQKILPVAYLRSSPEEDNPADNGISTVGHVDDKLWAIAIWRFEVIKPLLKDGRTKNEVIARAKHFDISPVTVYRWISDFETTGTTSALVPKYDQRGGAGKTRIANNREEIIRETLKKLYLNKQQLKPKKVHNEIKRLFSIAKLTPPHLNTIINRIKKFSNKQVASARKGKKWSQDHYEEKTGHYPGGKYPLDVIQIDHTRLDAILVDEKHREVTDRPWLTVAIDVFSRVIVGFYIYPDHSSYFSVSQCLTNAFLPKDKFLRSVNVEGSWDVWGKPHSIFADNAWEFRGLDLKRVCAEYEIILEWRPVKHPEYGGHIERLCGTLNGEIHSLPGTTFSNIQAKGQAYNSEKEAVMTISELERWFTDLVVNTYHKRSHAGINDMSPMAKYEMGIRGDDTMPGTGLPAAFEDEDRLRISLYPHYMRSVRRDGIVIENVHYYHDVLRKWINTSEGSRKRLFEVNYNPRDMSIVYFYDPELKKYFPIPYRNMTHKPLTLWDITAEKKYLHEQGMKTIDEDSIFRSYERRMNMVENSTEKTKQARKESRKRTEVREFHKRKHTQETHSVEPSKNGNDVSNAADVGHAKKSIFTDLLKNAKPFEGIKVIHRKTEGGPDGDKG